MPGRHCESFAGRRGAGARVRCEGRGGPAGCRNAAGYSSYGPDPSAHRGFCNFWLTPKRRRAGTRCPMLGAATAAAQRRLHAATPPVPRPGRMPRHTTTDPQLAEQVGRAHHPYHLPPRRHRHRLPVAAVQDPGETGRRRQLPLTGAGVLDAGEQIRLDRGESERPTRMQPNVDVTCVRAAARHCPAVPPPRCPIAHRPKVDPAE